MRKPQLNLWWESRHPSYGDDALRLSDFVNGLPNFDPIYQSWLSSPNPPREALPVPLTQNMAKQILADKIGRYDTGDLWPELGSRVSGGHAGPFPFDFRETSVADTRCHVGAFGLPAPANPNDIFMQLSKIRPTTGRPWRASELRPLMKFAREVWNPAQMCAIFWSTADLPEIADSTCAGGVRLLEPWIGWITYLPPDLVARAEYPADVEVETLDGGAALVTLCEEPFEKTDAEGMARLHALEAALRPVQS